MDHEQELREALHFRFSKAPADSQIVISRANADETGFRNQMYRQRDLNRIVEDFAGAEYNVWPRMTVLKEDVALGPMSRGKKADTLGGQVLWIDLDPDGTEGWKERTLSLIREFELPPSRIEDSGRGVYALWQLKEFERDWERLERVNRWLSTRFNADRCFSIDHILRAPGTLNPKPGVQRWAQLLEANDLEYTLDDFQEEHGRDALTIRIKQLEDLEPGALPFDFPQRVQATSRRLWQRIESEEGAREAGAILKSDENTSSKEQRVIRYLNDDYIATQLLRAGVPEDQVFSVLTHPTWFSGEKWREEGYHDSYALATIAHAQEKAQQPEFNNPTQLGQYLLEHYDIWHHLNTWFMYDARLGYYVDSENKLQCLIQDYCGDSWRPATASAVLDYIKPRTEHQAVDQPAWINVQNGMLNWQTEQLVPHNPSFRSTYQLNAAWDPKVDTTAVERFVASILPEDACQVWWMFCGYCFYVDTGSQMPYRSTMLLIGPSRTGKSQLAEAQTAFLGEAFVSTTAMSELTGAGNQFTTSQLTNKLLNYDDDAPYTQGWKETHLLKKLAVGAKITIEKKNHGATSARLPVKLLFLMNGIPSVSGGDGALEDRLNILHVRDDIKPFTSDNPDRIIQYSAKLFADAHNRNAWLLKAVRGMQALDKNGDFIEPASLQKSKEEFRRYTNPVYLFWKTQTQTTDIKRWVPVSVAYKTYSSWMRSEGHGEPLPLRVFTAKTRDLVQERHLEMTLRNSDRWEFQGRTLIPVEQAQQMPDGKIRLS